MVAARADRVLLLCCWRAGGVCGSGRLMPEGVWRFAELRSTPVLFHRPMPRLARPPIAVSVTLFSDSIAQV